MKSMLFHRLALSTDKEGVLKLVNEGHEIQHLEDLIKDPFVLEFLNIPEQHQYLESELEEKLINNLQHFLLELGKRFSFYCQAISYSWQTFPIGSIILSSHTEMFCSY